MLEQRAGFGAPVQAATDLAFLGLQAAIHGAGAYREEARSTGSGIEK